MCSAVFWSQFNGSISRLQRFGQSLPLIIVYDQKSGRIRLNARQFRPGLGIIRVRLHSLLISRDGGIHLARSKIRFPLQDIRVGSARGSGGCQKQRLDFTFIDLLQHPYSTQKHYNPQEHTVDIGLWLAAKKRSTRRNVHGVGVVSWAGVSSASGVDVSTAGLSRFS